MDLLIGAVDGVQLSPRLCDRRWWLLEKFFFGHVFLFFIFFGLEGWGWKEPVLVIFDFRGFQFRCPLQPHQIIWTTGIPFKIQIFTCLVTGGKVEYFFE